MLGNAFKECLGRSKDFRVKAMCAQQTFNPLQHARVVIDDRHELSRHQLLFHGFAPINAGNAAGGRHRIRQNTMPAVDQAPIVLWYSLHTPKR